MTIPLIGFLYLYFLFLAAWLIFSLVAFYHIIRYGQISLTGLLAATVYLAASIIILFLSYQYLSPIDWSAGLTIFQGGGQFFGASNF